MSVHIRGLRPLVRLAAIFTLTVAAAGAAQAQQKTDVIFSAGPTGGSWTPMAAAASQVVNKRYPELNVQAEPGAALVNMEKIRNDKADIGWSMTTVMADAQKGEGQFAGKATDKNVTRSVVALNMNIPAPKTPPIAIDTLQAGQSFFVMREKTFHRQVPVFENGKHKSNLLQMWVFGHVGMRDHSGKLVPDPDRRGWLPLRVLAEAGHIETKDIEQRKP